ncbi:hypothetical protein PYCC9005_003403 [Savitreella phatthalungensis]
MAGRQEEDEGGHAIFFHAGKLKIGETARFTVRVKGLRTSQSDPLKAEGRREEHDKHRLWVRVRNSSSTLMRTAYLNGPYILYTSICEQTYDHTMAVEASHLPPHFDADLKAGSSRWQQIPAPEEIEDERVYQIDVSSQIIFQSSSEVAFEVSIGPSRRELRKLSGKVQSIVSQAAAVSVTRQDTMDLWHMHPLTPFNLRKVSGDTRLMHAAMLDNDREMSPPRSKASHLVILTHGIHSNATSDMLYLKELLEARNRDRHDDIVCKAWAGNVCCTERGVKWLGKRLAIWLLYLTGWRMQQGGRMHRQESNPYREISLIAHSLGGLVQLYAIGYVNNRTAGAFFDPTRGGLKPVNFVTLASPLLGISAENPAYVKFALELGIIGKTGLDLALSPKPLGRYNIRDPAGGAQDKVVRSTMPLLQLMSEPGSACRDALRQFKARTIYANIVHDGIVPLRTSALYFLDWQSINQAYRERMDGSNGQNENLIQDQSDDIRRGAAPGQVSAGKADAPADLAALFNDDEEEDSPTKTEDETDSGSQVPNTLAVESEAGQGHHITFAQGTNTESHDPDRGDAASAASSAVSINSDCEKPPSDLSPRAVEGDRVTQDKTDKKSTDKAPASTSSIIPGFLGLLRPAGTHAKPKTPRALQRSQTVRSGDDDQEADGQARLQAPPRTSFFKALESVVNPPMPELDTLADPSKRDAHCILHDRMYHPSDIPPLKQKPVMGGGGETVAGWRQERVKLEEKIARNWHAEMSWRKVLVQLPPDAHNNIVVRRRFANSPGWPVLDHLVAQHFVSGHKELVKDHPTVKSPKAEPTTATDKKSTNATLATTL